MTESKQFDIDELRADLYEIVSHEGLLYRMQVALILTYLSNAGLGFWVTDDNFPGNNRFVPLAEMVEK